MQKAEHAVNSLRPSDAIWQCSSLSILAHVTACPIWHQVITWTNADLMSIGPFRTNLSELSIKIQQFPFKKINPKMLSAECQPICSQATMCSKNLFLAILHNVFLLTWFDFKSLTIVVPSKTSSSLSGLSLKKIQRSYKNYWNVKKKTTVKSLYNTRSLITTPFEVHWEVPSDRTHSYAGNYSTLYVLNFS